MRKLRWALGRAGGSSSVFAALVAVSLMGCDGGGLVGVDAGPPFQPDVVATGWAHDGRGMPNPGGACPDGEHSVGAVPMRLPISGVEYCVKATPECSTPGASCPLYVTINTNGAFFGRVDDPATHGALITVELYTETDGDHIKDKLAELPRVIANDYPGLDRERVYIVGWSAGAGAVSRGLCHRAKRSDFSEIGTTSDIYAAIATLGGCGCGNYLQLDGNWHHVSFNGMEDPFNGGDSCEARMRERAVVNGCSNPSASWQPVAADDPYARNGDGSANAERLDFGECARGAVVAYRGRDEAHVVSFSEHFDPRISGYDTVWRFLQGRRKR